MVLVVIFDAKVTPLIVLPTGTAPMLEGTKDILALALVGFVMDIPLIFKAECIAPISFGPSVTLLFNVCPLISVVVGTAPLTSPTFKVILALFVVGLLIVLPLHSRTFRLT